MNAALPLYCPACDRPFAEGSTCPNDGTKLVRINEDPLVGREIDGRFELRERIGAGGMGAVYKGWQRSVGREVAVKVIRSHVNAEAFEIKRFMREAQLTSRLVHPNIVSVIDFGQTPDGLLYLAMELLPGRPLNQVLGQTAGRRFSPERTVEIGVQLCDALQVAHEAQIIHRDLKPSNIMVLDGPGDRVKVLDFGLARPLQGDHSTLTASDLMLGTPSYMSPEMAENQPLDARSDLYSLGVVLYQLLNGKPPFSGDPRSVVVAKLQDDPPPLSEDVPRTLVNVVMRLLQRDPNRRYASAAVTREALLAARAWSSSAPLDAPSVEISVQSLPPKPRRAWWVVLVPAVLLMLGGVGWVLFRPQASAKKIEAPPPTEIVTAVKIEPSPEPKVVAPSPQPVVSHPPPVVREKVRKHKHSKPAAEDYILPN